MAADVYGEHPFDDLPGYRPRQRRRRRSLYRTPRRLSPRRLAAMALVVVMGLTASFGIRLALGLGALFHENPGSAVVDALTGSGSSPVAGLLRQGKPVVIALYGYGGSGHDGAYLSDSIMVIDIQPHPGGRPQVAMISVPRDWYVPIPLGNGKTAYGRVNEAYSDGYADTPASTGAYSPPLGGGQLGDVTLSNLLGLNIDYFVGVDFQAFVDAVNAVHGVTVDVPQAFTDNQYPAGGQCNAYGIGACTYTTIHFDAGVQQMNGTEALEYARSRHSTDAGQGTDFARSGRQQVILQAIKNKAESAGGVLQLPGLLSSLGKNVVTNLTIGDAEALYGALKGVSPSTFERFSVDDTNFLYECGYPRNCGAAYLFPHDQTFTSLHHYLQNLFPPAPVVSGTVPVTVYDGSGQRGTASARWAALLNAAGIHAQDGGTVPATATTQVVDQGGTAGSAASAWLGSYFGVPAQQQAAAAGTAPGVVLVLGRDEEAAFNNSTPGQYAGDGWR